MIVRFLVGAMIQGGSNIVKDICMPKAPAAVKTIVVEAQG